MIAREYRFLRWITALTILVVSTGVLSTAPSNLYAHTVRTDEGGEILLDLEAGCGQFQDVNSTTVPDTATRDGINFLACNGIVGGYACGGPEEPCVEPDKLPYFRPYSTLTRGQLAKIIVLSHARDDGRTLQRHFLDVETTNTFFRYAEIAFEDGLMKAAIGGTNCPTDPLICSFKPDDIASRGEAAKGAVKGAGYYTNHYGGTQQFADVNSSTTSLIDEINTGVIRELYTGYPCGGSSEPCAPSYLPYFRPNTDLTRGQFAKIDTNARFYHLGISGYGNLIPYRGSPNYQYGAAYSPIRPDLRLVPSGQMNAYTGQSGGYPSFHGAATAIRWNANATNWIKTNPENYTPVFELTGRYSSSGTTTCPPGINDAGSTNLPGAYSQFASEIPPCTNRLVIGDRQGLIQDTPYFYTDGWLAQGASGGSTGHMQLASAMIACTDKGCGYDILKADLLAHFCYGVITPGSAGKLIRCTPPTN